MSDDPCKHLKDEYESALNEWDEACQAASIFVGTTTVEDIHNSPPLNGDEMMKAYARKDAAFEKYKKAMSAYFECQEKYKQKKRNH